MSSRTHPERLLEALINEWNNRESVGVVIPPELESIILRHLQWAATMGAESVIHNITRRLELTPHVLRGVVSYNTVMEIVRTASPDESDAYMRVFQRNYKITTIPDVIEEPKTIDT
ncbi:MAG: hypothetical protein A3K54_00105 [Omnitrophica WOR_2 bacterium RBG_13_44_8]|nr:MAG: hypothetical protein A3K54_00105 [Omnitrophica WOR_2 bacterium RBG_13_44_8]